MRCLFPMMTSEEGCSAAGMNFLQYLSGEQTDGNKILYRLMIRYGGFLLYSTPDLKPEIEIEWTVLEWETKSLDFCHFHFNAMISIPHANQQLLQLLVIFSVSIRCHAVIKNMSSVLWCLYFYHFYICEIRACGGDTHSYLCQIIPFGEYDEQEEEMCSRNHHSKAEWLEAVHIHMPGRRKSLW